MWHKINSFSTAVKTHMLVTRETLVFDRVSGLGDYPLGDPTFLRSYIDLIIDPRFNNTNFP